MSDFNTLELQTDPRGFATLWLSREEKNNAFNAEMIRELILALDKVASDASLRFLLVRGRGKHFSAGADLAWMQQSAELDYHTNLDDARGALRRLYTALDGVNVPDGDVDWTNPRAAAFRAAMEAARAATRTQVIVINTTHTRTTDDGGCWWEVAIPEVSERAEVGAARAAYMAAKKEQRI